MIRLPEKLKLFSLIPLSIAWVHNIHMSMLQLTKLSYSNDHVQSMGCNNYIN